MAFKYLGEDVLTGFDKYKYSAVDTSPLSKYVTHPFWNWVVEFYPRWIAPNVLTLGGFMLLVVMCLIQSYYDYYFYACDVTHPEFPDMPTWVWYISAFCMFTAHTLDGTDGKQARRTKTSSPLGELFDHGLDSWATLLMPLGMYDVFSRGGNRVPPTMFFFLIMGVMVTFIITHWEKYNTGVLFLPWGYDASQIAMTVVYLVAGVWGHSIWKFHVPVINVYSEVFLQFFFYVGCFSAIPMTLWNIYKSYRDKTGKNRSLYEAMRPLFPAVVCFTLFITWMYCSSYDVLRKDPRLFYMATGTVFSNISSRLIVNCMSNTRCEVFNWLLIPLLAIVVGVLTLDLGVTELYLLWAFTIFATAAHLHYGFCVVQQLAEHLNIYAFSVEKRGKKN